MTKEPEEMKPIPVVDEHGNKIEAKEPQQEDKKNGEDKEPQVPTIVIKLVGNKVHTGVGGELKEMHLYWMLEKAKLQIESMFIRDAMKKEAIRQKLAVNDGFIAKTRNFLNRKH